MAGADHRQDQGNPYVALGADGPEQIDRLVAEVAHPAGPHPPLEPPPTDPTGLADPGFVEDPDLEPLGLGVVVRHLGDQRREFFLKRACALRSASGWIGRVFCQDRPRSWSSRSIPFSL